MPIVYLYMQERGFAVEELLRRNVSIQYVPMLCKAIIAQLALNQVFSCFQCQGWRLPRHIRSHRYINCV